MNDNQGSERLPQGDLHSSITLFFAARDGSTAALNALYSRYLPRLSRWASGRLPSGSRSLQETGDLIQDVLQNFLSKLDTFSPNHEGAVMAYLRMAVMNRIRDAARRVSRQPNFVDIDDRDIAGHRPTPYEECIESEVRRRFELALAKLTAEERAAVTLKVEFAYGPSAIAEALGKTSPDAARMFTQRALRKLAEEMDDV